MAKADDMKGQDVDANEHTQFTQEQRSRADRRQFLDLILGAWAGKDTDAALGWAQQISDPAERDAALQAIRQVAPVGIGTQVGVFGNEFQQLGRPGQPLVGPPRQVTSSSFQRPIRRAAPYTSR